MLYILQHVIIYIINIRYKWFITRQGERMVKIMSISRHFDQNIDQNLRPYFLIKNDVKLIVF